MYPFILFILRTIHWTAVINYGADVIAIKVYFFFKWKNLHINWVIILCVISLIFLMFILAMRTGSDKWRFLKETWCFHLISLYLVWDTFEMLKALNSFLKVLCGFMTKGWQCLAWDCSAEKYCFPYLAYSLGSPFILESVLDSIWHLLCTDEEKGGFKDFWFHSVTHCLLLVFEERELHDFASMFMLPPFAASIRRWIVLSKMQLFIEVPSGLCSCTYRWGTISGSKGLCSWILFTYLVVLCTSNQTTSQNKIKKPSVGLSCPCRWILPVLTDFGHCCNSVTEILPGLLWSLGRSLSISLIFSSELWLVASLLTAHFPLTAILSLLLIYPEICSLSKRRTESASVWGVHMTCS